jgi:D-xylose transport system ATP-binding protein
MCPGPDRGRAHRRLGPAETAQVRSLIRQLKSEGLGIFLVSHDIHDVFDLADRISVMYHGRLVGTVNKADVAQLRT